MKAYYFLFVLYLVGLKLDAQYISFDLDAGQGNNTIKTGVDVLKKMYLTYKNAPCQRYVFSQKNKHYKNDSVVGMSEWFESIEFPDKFRIDFGNKTDGNFVIFRNDSVFRYKAAELKKATPDTNTLLLLLGGMYYRDLKDVLLRLQHAKYNTTIVTKQKFRKQKVYVVGALAGDTLSNQLWIDKKNLRVVRIIEKMDDKHTMDMTFDAFEKHCKGYIESAVTFKNNGKVEQVETYFDIKTVDTFDVHVFYP